MNRVYVPKDSTALSLGADEVAAAFAAQGFEVVRTGSRGLFWLEPLVEVDTPSGRFGYGPVGAADVGGLVAAGIGAAGSHPLAIGLVEIGRAHV